MLILFLIIIALILIGFCIYQSRTLIDLTSQKKKVLEELLKLNQAIEGKHTLLQDVSDTIEFMTQELENLTSKKADLLNQIENHKESIDISNSAFESYFELLEQKYEDIDEEYQEKLKSLEASYTEKKETLLNEAVAEYNIYMEDINAQRNEQYLELKKLKDTVNAANEAIRVAELDKAAKSAYQLQITESDLSDVKKLLALCSNFNNARALRMVVWSSYFQKETNNLCTRVQVNGITGIYKLTNLLTNKVYVGQSKDTSSRWKTHIKCGLGIDTPVTNELYKAMLQDGVWNFSFELLEECKPEELNECERKWIAFYESDTYGYNGNKGVGK